MAGVGLGALAPAKRSDLRGVVIISVRKRVPGLRTHTFRYHDERTVAVRRIGVNWHKEVSHSGAQANINHNRILPKLQIWTVF